MSILLGGSAKRRVARGVKFLDAVDPDWFNRIDTETLNLNNINHCVVAQITGLEYDAGLKVLSIGKRRGVWYGFDAVTYDAYMFSAPWNELRTAWIRAIRTRRDEQMSDMMQALDGVHHA